MLAARLLDHADVTIHSCAANAPRATNGSPANAGGPLDRAFFRRAAIEKIAFCLFATVRRLPA
jgi:hypothetical protein